MRTEVKVRTIGEFHIILDEREEIERMDAGASLNFHLSRVEQGELLKFLEEVDDAIIVIRKSNEKETLF